MRSRTGCLTCRQRKLKCDEQKPVCGQCTKANRQCQPSSGLTFRHQHNASMNANDDGTWPERNPSLSGFYAYKNTFNDKTVWVDIPKQLTFFNTSNPYTDPGTPDLEATMSTQVQSPYAQQNHDQWNVDHQLHDQAAQLHSHGLEALSAAALYAPPEANMIPQPTSMNRRHFDSPFGSPSPNNEHGTTTIPSPNTVSPSSNNLNFLLNPPDAMDSPIDPSLMSTHAGPVPPPSSGTATENAEKTQVEGEAESEHKVAFLLRHFSDSPGKWMDLFDHGAYFGSYVPVQARSHPLLKHAACACAAKQLGRAKRAKAITGGVYLQHANLEVFDDSSVDWEWEGAYHYDRSIALLMETMQRDQNQSSPDSPGDTAPAWETSEYAGSVHGSKGGNNPSHVGTARLKSDVVVAATAILCVYEFLSATGTAWSRHLNGTKSLLDIAEGGMMPLGELRVPPSKARRATFWNFARQDYLAAFINECQTRLDTDDFNLWREAGLLIDKDGYILFSGMKIGSRPSPSERAGKLSGHGMSTSSKVLGVEDSVKEDMISNALVWLSSRLCNFIAAGEGFAPIPGDRSESLQEEEPGEYGKSQKSLLEKWKSLAREFEVWFEGLPATFQPTTRIKSSRNMTLDLRDLDQASNGSFDEIWYTNGMCGATMQHYHMARILLLVNKPHESTMRRSTIANRLNSYRLIGEEIVYHCYEICGIALSSPEASVRIHQTQPLFVAGQCLSQSHERRVVLGLLRGIETDLGWATENRVQQLLNEWGWVDE